MTFQYFFFDTYIGYFLQMLPIALLISATYGIIRYRTDKTTPLMKKVWSCVFVCYMTGLVCLTIGFDVIGVLWYRLIYHMDSGRTIWWFSGAFDLVPDFFRNINSEVVGNVLMFMPFGILYPLARERFSFRNTILVGFFAVLVIELVQPVFGRSFDMNDIILNTLGILASVSAFWAVTRLLGRYDGRRNPSSPS